MPGSDHPFSQRGARASLIGGTPVRLTLREIVCLNLSFRRGFPLLLLLIIFQQLAHRLLQRTTRLSISFREGGPSLSTDTVFWGNACYRKNNRRLLETCGIKLSSYESNGKMVRWKNYLECEIFKYSMPKTLEGYTIHQDIALPFLFSTLERIRGEILTIIPLDEDSNCRVATHELFLRFALLKYRWESLRSTAWPEEDFVGNLDSERVKSDDLNFLSFQFGRKKKENSRSVE